MYTPKPDIASLITARMCHDLASPLGAIANGLELLELTGVTGPEMDLLTDSITNANARARFFRIAYGPQDKGTQLSAADVQSLLNTYLPPKVNAVWTHCGPTDSTRVQLIFLMLQCIETALPYGGDVTLDPTNGHACISVRAEAIRLNTDLWDTLQAQDCPADMPAAAVQFALLKNCVASHGLTLSWAEDGTAMQFSAKP